MGVKDEETGERLVKYLLEQDVPQQVPVAFPVRFKAVDPRTIVPGPDRYRPPLSANLALRRRPKTEEGYCTFPMASKTGRGPAVDRAGDEKIRAVQQKKHDLAHAMGVPGP